ncbi:L-rhamnonate dehydratase [Conexibacter sp. CPCC 206217]|uniref:L-rhamnonate dehydratase n=1 Tax=Conexibacter sp. CPCC 206217 TaxID=3064574 RepID=UPI00272661B1|nr:L-rhamnonate dehydratase [Conexibacter sp. CPCC 206217]MDO8213160.1 L-rhamnonate dehydratase [Conexibacter sp. CPCC 206217]
MTHDEKESETLLNARARSTARVASVRAYVVAGGGADYHDQASGHWIDGQIATPMSPYPEYRMTRSSFGLNALGTVIVEVESDTGEVGVGVSTGGPPACWLVENHLARFVEGRPVHEIERSWDQMWRASLYYGRKGLAVNAISAVDLALWDLLGRLREEPVHAMIGGAVRDEISFYATGPRPDLAREMGFVGGKMTLKHGPAEGTEGLRKNVEIFAEMRERAGDPDQFFMSYDCWMALDLTYALRLIDALAPYQLRWLEEFLPPDDYWGYAEARRRAPRDVLLSTGEHEWSRWGFRMLIDMGCADFVQPDVNWCGGMTELLKIAAYADAHDTPVIPHGSSVYSYHFVCTRPTTPYAEFLMLHHDATEVIPMFSPLFLDEPVPVNGRIRVSALDKPGFGVEIDPSLARERPFAREALV